jgi:hypothetical protein
MEEVFHRILQADPFVDKTLVHLVWELDQEIHEQELQDRCPNISEVGVAESFLSLETL